MARSLTGPGRMPDSQSLDATRVFAQIDEIVLLAVKFGGNIATNPGKKSDKAPSFAVRFEFNFIVTLVKR